MQFSEMELRTMRSAFKQEFDVSDDIVDSPAIKEWMQAAPVALIEYEGYLDGETKSDRDHRMQMSEVYDGDIRKLAEYIKTLNPEHRSKTKWQLLFTIYKGIKSPDGLIEQAKQYSTPTATDGKIDEAQIASAASKSSGMVRQTGVEAVPTLEQFVQETGEIVSTLETGEADDDSTEKVEESSHSVQAEALGKAEVEPDVPLSHTTNNIIEKSKEDKEMADSNFNSTNGSDIQADGFKQATDTLAMEKGFQTQNPGTGSKPQSTDVDTTAAAEILNATTPARQAYVKSHVVTALLVNADATVNRIKNPKNPMGTVCKPGMADDEIGSKKLGAIDTLVDKFSKAVGRPFSEITKEMSDEEAFPHCVGTRDARIARAVWDTLVILKGNADAQIPAYVGAPSYSVKGYRIDQAQYLNDAEMKNEILAKTLGGFYGAGSLDGNGEPKKDTAVTFAIVLAKKTIKNNNKGDKASSSNGTKTDEGVKTVVQQIRIANKKLFLEDSKNRIAIFPTDKTATVYGKFKALVSVAKGSTGTETADLPATFKVKKFKADGTPEMLPKQTVKDEEKQATMTFTLQVYVPMDGVSKTVDASLVGVVAPTAEKIVEHYAVKTARTSAAKETHDYTMKASEDMAKILALQAAGTLVVAENSAEVAELIGKVAESANAKANAQLAQDAEDAQ